MKKDNNNHSLWCIPDNINKHCYWLAILYPENMIDDWENRIGDVLQLPFCYCIHDKDLLKESNEERKKHVHLIVAFPNTTTISHAFNIINQLSAPGKQAIPGNVIKAAKDIRWAYDYLIHDTESARKQRKHLYDKSERICGNNFDIGNYEQISMERKQEIVSELSQVIRENFIYNYGVFYEFVTDHFDDPLYKQLVHSYSGHFERLTRANWQRIELHNQNIDI